MSGDENIDDIGDEEKQKIYAHFCQLITILHDYAIGKKLFSEKSYSWAITANYYSLMHCGRFICTLGIGQYPTMHAQLHKLLSGESSWNSFTSQQVYSSVDSYVSNSECKIETLGNKLKVIKEIREHNSYELFIIAHQHDHVYLKDKFLACYSNVESINLEYIEFCLDMLVEYINKSPSKEFYIAFLKNNSEKYENPIQSFITESIFIHRIDQQIMNDINQLINNKLMNFQTEKILQDSFFTAINYHNFDSKSDVMQNFEQKINQL